MRKIAVVVAGIAALVTMLGPVSAQGLPETASPPPAGGFAAHPPYTMTENGPLIHGRVACSWSTRFMSGSMRRGGGTRMLITSIDSLQVQLEDQASGFSVRLAGPEALGILLSKGYLEHWAGGAEDDYITTPAYDRFLRDIAPLGGDDAVAGCAAAEDAASDGG